MPIILKTSLSIVIISSAALSLLQYKFDKEYKSINYQLYGDNWVGVSDTKSGMKEALIKFSNIVRKNYDKLK